MIDVPAATRLLRHARPHSLRRLAELLVSPVGEQQALSVALDVALVAGPIARRALAWIGEDGRAYSPILGGVEYAAPAYGAFVKCFAGEAHHGSLAAGTPRMGKGDLRGVARAWACDLAEEIARSIGETDTRCAEALAASRAHVEGDVDVALEGARQRVRNAASWRPLDGARIAARTAILHVTSEDAWFAAWQVARIALDWRWRSLVLLVEHVGARKGKISLGTKIVHEATWMERSIDLEARAVAAIEP